MALLNTKRWLPAGRAMPFTRGVPSRTLVSAAAPENPSGGNKGGRKCPSSLRPPSVHPRGSSYFRCDIKRMKREAGPTSPHPETHPRTAASGKLCAEHPATKLLSTDDPTHHVRGSECQKHLREG